MAQFTNFVRATSRSLGATTHTNVTVVPWRGLSVALLLAERGASSGNGRRATLQLTREEAELLRDELNNLL